MNCLGPANRLFARRRRGEAASPVDRNARLLTTLKSTWESSVCLLKLAELACLSLHHLCRAFKQSLGMPAHQYQVQRRMEAAKLLLADRANSVTDIALSLGYAQTNSFSNAFRKTTGWTPTLYRREFT
jgi:AraC-like DNA-binding protein